MGNVRLTGSYKFRGFILSLREYLRILDTIASTHPEELNEKIVEDVASVAEEAAIVADYLNSQFEKEEEKRKTPPV